MLSEKDLIILCNLRRNARETLTKISKKTNIPVSTIFEKLKAYRNEGLVRYTTIINFNKLGFDIKANVMIRVPKEKRKETKEYLIKHQNINSVLKINNGFDFLFECIFTSIKELEDFLEMLEERFNIEEKQVYYVVEEIKKEEFMSHPETLGLLKN